MRPHRVRPRVAGALLTAVALATWGFASGASAARLAPAPAPSPLRVFAAASLAATFEDLARQFERGHPGVTVRLNLAGSQQLATQIEQGAAAEIFASADRRWMDYARERGLIADRDSVFAHNRLIVILPRTNPAHIGRLQDLARRGVKVVLGAPAVPVGEYGREALRRLSADQAFGSDYGQRVLANVVSEEENVKSVVGKIQLGEADAGIVYRSDVTPAVSRLVRVLEIPEAANVVASYPIALVKGATSKQDARDFVALVFSSDGQRTLERHGLIPLASPAP